MKRFLLPILLPEGSSLILNTEQGILSQLTEGELVIQQLLTPSETRLIMKLLEAYPEYCSTEILLSIHTGESVDECRQRLLKASKEQTVQDVTKSLRAVLARCRKKLYPFGIDVATVLGRGCLLGPLNRKVQRFILPERVGLNL